MKKFDLSSNKAFGKMGEELGREKKKAESSIISLKLPSTWDFEKSFLYYPATNITLCHHSKFHPQA